MLVVALHRYKIMHESVGREAGMLVQGTGGGRGSG